MNYIKKFLIAICRPTGNKRQLKTLFLAIFDPYSLIVKNFFDCRLSGVLFYFFLLFVKFILTGFNRFYLFFYDQKCRLFSAGFSHAADQFLHCLPMTAGLHRFKKYLNVQGFLKSP